MKRVDGGNFHYTPMRNITSCQRKTGRSTTSVYFLWLSQYTNGYLSPSHLTCHAGRHVPKLWPLGRNLLGTVLVGECTIALPKCKHFTYKTLTAWTSFQKPRTQYYYLFALQKCCDHTGHRCFVKKVVFTSLSHSNSFPCRCCFLRNAADQGLLTALTLTSL